MMRQVHARRWLWISAAGLVLACSVAAVTGRAPVLEQGTAGAADGARLYAQHCASCHETRDAARIPSPAALAAMPPAKIVSALDAGGVMALQGQALSAPEKRAVAAHLTRTNGTPAAEAADPTAGVCSSRPAFTDLTSRPMWNGWGNDVANTRFQDAGAAGLTAAQVPQLVLKWAFGFEGATAASGQPAVAGGRVFVGNVNGTVYSLDLRTGCTYWTFTAEAGVRTAPSIARVTADGVTRILVMVGDLRANVYGLDATTGVQVWKTKADPHQLARITGAPTHHAGMLYVPVSSIEEVPGGSERYPCCTFRGSVVALEAATGRQVWKTFMIDEEPRIVGKNAIGTPIWKPAGAAIWTSPTIDVARGRLYVATGNAYTTPAAATSDAVVALDLGSGKILWAQQVTPNDVFLVRCKPGVGNCPDDVGPDFDFGNSPILRTLPGGRRILTLGQKSGIVYGIAPDDEGKVLWQVRAGKGGELGGIEWGSAADDRHIYVPVSDVLHPPAEAGGLFAFDLATGARVWHTPAPALACSGGPGCSGAQSAAISVIPGAVFSGAIDGHLRAYSTEDGTVLWDFDTMRPFDTVNGVKAQGGSIDAAGPVIVDGIVLTNSGYGQWLGRPGNVLLAFGHP